MEGRVNLKIIVVTLVVAGALAYYLVDPATSVWMPKCMFRVITGYDCPGCGSQRMLHALLHGDIAAAWDSNPFILLMLPFIALAVYAATFRLKHPVLYRRVNSPIVIAVLCVLIVGWGVGRNL